MQGGQCDMLGLSISWDNTTTVIRGSSNHDEAQRIQLSRPVPNVVDHRSRSNATSSTHAAVLLTTPMLIQRRSSIFYPQSL